jgi:cytochrome c5
MKAVAVVFLCLSAVTAMCGCAKHWPIKAPGGIVLRSQRIYLPAHGRAFSGDPQASVANTYCLMCHSGGMVMTQPPLTLSQWQAELRKMIKTYGCPLPQSDVDKLAQFMVQSNQNLAVRAP